MSPSTKRALRTGYQGLVALIVIVPVLVAGVPALAQAATVVAALAGVAKILNALEDAHLIPSWLKSDAEVTVSQIDSMPGVEPEVVAVPADVPADPEA